MAKLGGRGRKGAGGLWGEGGGGGWMECTVIEIQHNTASKAFTSLHAALVHCTFTSTQSEHRMAQLTQ